MAVGSPAVAHQPAGEAVQHVFDQACALGLVEHFALGLEQFADNLADLHLDPVARHFVQRGEIDFFQQLTMDPHLQVEQPRLVALALYRGEFGRRSDRRVAVDTFSRGRCALDLPDAHAGPPAAKRARKASAMVRISP